MITVGDVVSPDISNAANVGGNNIISNIGAIIPIAPEDTIDSTIPAVVKYLVDDHPLGGIIPTDLLPKVLSALKLFR